MIDEENRNFWDERAALGDIAGTNDFLLKELELKLLRERIPDNARVLDIGCGNGQTLIMLAREKNCSCVGIDFSEKMVELAVNNVKKHGQERHILLQQGAIQKLPEDIGLFDCVITERTLINLGSEKEQYNAFVNIMKHVDNEGRYLMIESSIDGLRRINELRQSFGLEPINPPWHNVFFREEFVQSWADHKYILEETFPFSSTYYLLSRVVYAKIANDKKEELHYDSDINLIACKLPAVGNFGPARLWVWRKAAK
jgi:cyclopropane fatty-acyl-phospholipid synthase-like methyltransferase